MYNYQISNINWIICRFFLKKAIQIFWSIRGILIVPHCRRFHHHLCCTLIDCIMRTFQARPKHENTLYIYVYYIIQFNIPYSYLGVLYIFLFFFFSFLLLAPFHRITTDYCHVLCHRPDSWMTTSSAPINLPVNTIIFTRQLHMSRYSCHNR